MSLDKLRKDGWSYHDCGTVRSADGELPGPNQVLVTDAEGKRQWVERVHRYEEKETTIVQEMTATGMFAIFVVAHHVKPDRKYIVLYNGTEYECIPKVDSVGHLHLGNLKLMNLAPEDTGEPFLFTGVDVSGVSSYAFFKDRNATHTFSVTGPSDFPLPIDAEWIPNSVVKSFNGILPDETGAIDMTVIIRITESSSGLTSEVIRGADLLWGVLSEGKITLDDIAIRQTYIEKGKNAISYGMTNYELVECVFSADYEILKMTYRFVFGDAPSILADCVNLAITLDPDWVKPNPTVTAATTGTAGQIAVSDGAGGIVWKNLSDLQ